MGNIRNFTLPLDLNQQTPFQRKVLMTIQEIPYGQVSTYAEIDNTTGIAIDNQGILYAATPGGVIVKVLGDGSFENFASGFTSPKDITFGPAGNLYVATTRGLGIQVFSPEGDHLGNIECPSISNNIYFGGEDLKTLYVGAKDGIYKIRVKIPGLRVPKELQL